MGDLIILANRRVKAPVRPRIVSAVCDVLLTDRRCLGLLAYENGRWVHALTCRSCASGGLLFCDDPDLHVPRGDHEPEARQCAHATCREPADPAQVCVTGDPAECCGCCWEIDPREGAHRWRR